MVDGVAGLAAKRHHTVFQLRRDLVLDHVGKPIVAKAPVNALAIGLVDHVAEDLAIAPVSVDGGELLGGLLALLIAVQSQLAWAAFPDDEASQAGPVPGPLGAVAVDGPAAQSMLPIGEWEGQADF